MVDDGSGEKYQPVFQQVSEIPRTTVLRHEENQGKGMALKTGYRYIQTLNETFSGVINDADNGSEENYNIFFGSSRISNGHKDSSDILWDFYFYSEDCDGDDFRYYGIY